VKIRYRILKFRSIYNRILKALKYFIFTLGLIFIILITLSFTSLPFWGIYRLAVSESDYNFTPETIVLMGGSGMPGETALMRTYYTADLAKKYPKAAIIIALPDNLQDSNSHLKRMEQELRVRSVKSKILFEYKGTNTRLQALNIKDILKSNLNQKIVVVSSPSHMYRAIKSFKKLGFLYVGGSPTFENDLSQSLDVDSDNLGGHKLLSNIAESSQVRYQFWNHLKYEIVLLREYVAIVYYKLQAWI